MADSEYRFPSELHPEAHAFIFHTSSMDLWDACYRGRNNNFLSMHVGMYPTHGDGMTQHGSEHPVYPENAEDAMLSFAAWVDRDVFGMPLDEMGRVAGCIPSVPNWSTVAAAMKVVHKGENKRTWYEKDTFKVSSSESKRHDKRWEEVPSWADGSQESVYRLLTAEDRMRSLLEKLRIVERIAEVFTVDGSKSCYGPVSFFCIGSGQPLIPDHEKRRDLQNAYDAARRAFDAMGHRIRLHGLLAHTRDNRECERRWAQEKEEAMAALALLNLKPGDVVRLTEKAREEHSSAVLKEDRPFRVLQVNLNEGRVTIKTGEGDRDAHSIAANELVVERRASSVESTEVCATLQ